MTGDKAGQLPSSVGRSFSFSERSWYSRGLFATSLYSHHLPQCVTWGGGWEGVLQFAGDPLPWEELLRVSVFYRRQQLSDPGAPPLLPHRPEHQVCRPRVSGGTTAASWAHGVVGREGVVLLSGPLTADSQEVLAALGTGRSRSRIQPLPAAVHPPAPA